MAEVWQILDQGVTTFAYPDIENIVAAQLHVVCNDPDWPAAEDRVPARRLAGDPGVEHQFGVPGHLEGGGVGGVHVAGNVAGNYVLLPAIPVAGDARPVELDELATTPCRRSSSVMVRTRSTVAGRATGTPCHFGSRTEVKSLLDLYVDLLFYWGYDGIC